MKYLLDVNVLVAWGWADHEDHLRAAKWIAAEIASSANHILTSPIPELGFVRVSVQRGRGLVTPEQASTTLETMVRVLGPIYEFLPDDESARAWPPWCQGAARTTDAHLLALAGSHQVELATLDTGIPGAYLIP